MLHAILIVSHLGGDLAGDDPGARKTGENVCPGPGNATRAFQVSALVERPPGFANEFFLQRLLCAGSR
jgi:hypothetical protein